MKQFFNSVDSLQNYMSSLNFHHDKLRCRHCKQSSEFVVHDYIYRKQRNGLKRIIGKRLFCSNRYNKKGCGKTLMLYVKTTIPTMRYLTVNIDTFIKALFEGETIQQAYEKATRCQSSRNAYRWLNKLYRRFMDYRVAIAKPSNAIACQQTFKTWRANLLYPTIGSVISPKNFSSCADYQLERQLSII